MRGRVYSGARVLTIAQAITDEKLGGNFIASMSETEYSAFLSKLGILISSAKKVKIRTGTRGKKRLFYHV